MDLFKNLLYPMMIFCQKAKETLQRNELHWQEIFNLFSDVNVVNAIKYVNYLGKK